MMLTRMVINVKNVGITGHIRPDGDCVGSCMALYNYIISNYEDICVDVYLEDVGEEFNFITNIDKVKKEPLDKIYDVFVVLDCSDLDRIAPFRKCYDNAKSTVCVDHHISNLNYADKNIVKPDASSCAQVLFELLDESKINRAVAECIYIGIIHDTGVFKYSSTSKETMEIAGKMMEHGIDFTSIIDNSFYMRTYAQTKILGKAIGNSKLLCDDKIIASYIDFEDMEECGVNNKQLGGVVEQLRLTNCVEVAAFIYQVNIDEYKVSLRSKSIVDVSTIAMKFGGGGHIRAAGFNMKGTKESIFETLVEEIAKQL